MASFARQDYNSLKARKYISHVLYLLFLAVHAVQRHICGGNFGRLSVAATREGKGGKFSGSPKMPLSQHQVWPPAKIS